MWAEDQTHHGLNSDESSTMYMDMLKQGVSTSSYKLLVRVVSN